MTHTTESKLAEALRDMYTLVHDMGWTTPDNRYRTITNAAAELAAYDASLKHGAVADGMVLVPRVATPKMLQAGVDANDFRQSKGMSLRDDFAVVYDAMICASPTPHATTDAGQAWHFESAHDDAGKTFGIRIMAHDKTVALIPAIGADNEYQAANDICHAHNSATPAAIDAAIAAQQKEQAKRASFDPLQDEPK